MFYNSSALHKKFIRPSLGFGLVELMVSVGIISLVATVVLVQQRSYNSAVLLRSQAYEIALRLRNVQLSAVSSANTTGDDTGFRSVLGVHFDTDPAHNGVYKIFKDGNSDGFYDLGEQYDVQGKLDPRFEIRAIRAEGTPVVGGMISVVFERPNFDARFFRSTSVEQAGATIEIDIARREATGNGPGDIRTIEITKTGQIAVKSI
jgi:type II secretory pathway pseudopilin PulG